MAGVGRRPAAAAAGGGMASRITVNRKAMAHVSYVADSLGAVNAAAGK